MSPVGLGSDGDRGCGRRVESLRAVAIRHHHQQRLLGGEADLLVQEVGVFLRLCRKAPGSIPRSVVEAISATFSGSCVPWRPPRSRRSTSALKLHRGRRHIRVEDVVDQQHVAGGVAVGEHRRGKHQQRRRSPPSPRSRGGGERTSASPRRLGTAGPGRGRPQASSSDADHCGWSLDELRRRAHTHQPDRTAGRPAAERVGEHRNRRGRPPSMPAPHRRPPPTRRRPTTASFADALAQAQGADAAAALGTSDASGGASGSTGDGLSSTLLSSLLSGTNGGSSVGTTGTSGSTGTSTATTSTSLPASASTLLTSDQQQFAQRLAADTGLDPGVVSSWLLAEESGGAAQSRQAANNNDWLNIGYTGSGTFGASDSVWSDPTAAADATAGWLKGQNTIPGYGRRAPASRTSSRRSVPRPPPRSPRCRTPAGPAAGTRTCRRSTER